MSGHNKWSTIKHKKARTDEKKGKEYTKIAKEIIIAVRAGGSDPESNSKLKLAIQNAKAINMPNENISRAIKRGAGDMDTDAIEELTYEGYAPGGVAVMLAIATDNRNRTAADIRHLFAKYNGNLGETGCVSYMFERVGLLSINRENLQMDADDLMMLALDAGADDVREDDDVIEVVTSPDNFMAVREALEAEINLDQADIVMLPNNTVDISDETLAAKVLKLIDVLEDHDDVQKVYANFNIPDEILEKIM
ncbi:MAG TPA: YebC/PmpR family DNA-binding transcriptional regulator [Syntrophomonadaceae bacterium]|nr:YebC/PmpR family DNA-binding transcriptional regulator [Syntrophomonadaceae bacterium]